MFHARPLLIAAALLALSATPGFAAGTSSDSDSNSTTNPTPYQMAVAHVQAEEYADAIELLTQVVADEPQNADAYNYLAFSQRKMGFFDGALENYLTALEIEPEHLGANEYLGELYLQMDELEKAEERLQVLKDACFFSCEEEDELEEAIEDYKHDHGLS